MTLRSFEEILLVVSCLAMNGSFFVGELPSWLQNTDIGIKVSCLIYKWYFLSSSRKITPRCIVPSAVYNRGMDGKAIQEQWVLGGHGYP